jgi:hypothetical protein
MITHKQNKVPSRRAYHCVLKIRGSCRAQREVHLQPADHNAFMKRKEKAVRVGLAAQPTGKNKVRDIVYLLPLPRSSHPGLSVSIRASCNSISKRSIQPTKHRGRQIISIITCFRTANECRACTQAHKQHMQHETHVLHMLHSCSTIMQNTCNTSLPHYVCTYIHTE